MKLLKRMLGLMIVCVCCLSIEKISASEVGLDTSTLYVKSQNIVIIDNPVNQVCEEGQKITLAVVASGQGLTYRWQYQWPNETGWTDWKGEGYDTASTSYVFERGYDGIKLRCIVTGSDGESVITESAECKLKAPLAITKQPESQICEAGQKVT
ncbi:hypothetical protein, partial [Agathobacter sp.]